mmetsp:Transcript_18175/g.20983  ORF Transcript_18175/g.20983 Transcript_18175/m.20983 type:complete len:234 (-) Transcript_18175:85-786(-)|eukprot:CAMPEP_0194181708 /NCGR_PEP_ID=MMETSP0154-20130528/21080_1 /TAXON_ID=1049557 /ORGANISM="Thalassiothrix antarctica, Strain L6-D1" /LENGTH=233 /DNA_ID=CAMNT_0038897749 /DNA_START=137 /DNA_END=838 /DNA_ORIENTATION=-
MTLRYCSFLHYLLLIAFAITCASSSDISINFDEDQASVDYCTEKAEKKLCTRDHNTYFECPITCASHNRPERPHWGGFEKKESPFYDFQLKDVNGKVINFEDFDGQVTVVALVPLYPGLAAFHQKLLEHVFELYKRSFVVTVVLLPMVGQHGVSLEKPSKNSKLIMLDGVGDIEHPLVQYLSKKIQKGVFDVTLLNSFIISPEGTHLEMHIDADLKMYRQYIESHIKDLDDEL